MASGSRSGSSRRTRSGPAARSAGGRGWCAGYTVSRKRAASTSMRATAARGSASSADRSCSRETRWRGPARPHGCRRSARRPGRAPRSRRSAHRVRASSERPGRSTRASPSTMSSRSHPASPDLHDRLAVGELALLAEREDRVEELAREQREDSRILDQPLVASSVEEQRAALPVARELDLAEERASGRRPSTSGRRERRGGRARPRRAASRARSRTSPPAGRPPPARRSGPRDRSASPRAR